MEIALREYADPDLPFVRGCYAAYLEEERRRVPVLGLPDHFADGYLPRLIDKVRDQQGAFLIAEVDRAPAGYIAALPKDPQAWDQTRSRTVMIMDLYVVPGHRRHGIGRRLFDAIERRFAAAGIGWATLGTMAGNTEARAFYASLGYRETYLFVGKPLPHRAGRLGASAFDPAPD
jgi:GNAT superfamily N-acetyltransferase